MGAVGWVLTGFILGWLVEWIIDWLYWRRSGAAAPDAERERLASEVRALRADFDRQTTDLQQAQHLARQQADELGLRQRELDEVRGVQAQTLAGGVSFGVTGGGASSDEVDRLEAEKEQLRTELVALRDELARAQAAAARLEHERDEAHATLTAYRAQQVDQPAAPIADRLIDINGVGPVYERRLNEAGIFTFAQLATMTPEQIRAIIKPQSWQGIDEEAWIAEARHRAGLS